MIKKSLVFMLLLAGLVSCTEEMKNKRKLIKKKYKLDLINYDHCFTEKENRMSFPLFFNDSLIKKHGIVRIERSMLNEDNEATCPEPNEIRTYDFDENGTIAKVNIVQFYEHSPMSKISFNYPKGLDEYGFGDVEVKRQQKNELTEKHYEIFIKEEYADKYLVYVDKNSGNYLFYLKNSINWGSVSVDSILQPTPEDVVVYGTPRQPNKEFKIVNKVNELEVKTVEYVGDGNTVSKLTFNKYPFEYRRSIEYNDAGVCTGFIDSTFTAEQFLMRRISTISRNNKGLPIEISHQNDTEDNDGFKQIEKFEYEYKKK